MQAAALALHPKGNQGKLKIKTAHDFMKSLLLSTGNGSDKLLKISCALAGLTSWYNDLDGGRTKENPRTSSCYMEKMKRLVH